MVYDSPIQQGTKAAQRHLDNEQGKTAPYVGTVVSVTGYQDQLGMKYGPTSKRLMPIQHPFCGSSSWIRSVPGIGTVYLLQNRFDSQQPEALKTIPIGSQDRSNAYLQGKNIYRTLESGEHDVVSSGIVTMYMGRRGDLDIHVGVGAKSNFSRDSLQDMVTTPMHRRNGLLWAVGTMGDEERLGIVKRWTNPVAEYYPQKGGNFQAEHYLQLKNPAGSAPTVLIERVEGQVYDSVGQIIKQTLTSFPLRSSTKWYTNTDEVLKREIDQNGNVYVEFPNTATTGEYTVIPKGSYNLDVGENSVIAITKDSTTTVGGNVFESIQGTVAWEVAKKVGFTVGSPGGENSLVLDGTTPGAGVVGMINDNTWGFQADGTSTMVWGPKSSGVFFNASGDALLQDGAQDGIIASKGTVTIFSTGGRVVVGDTIVMTAPGGGDFIDIEDNLIQVMGAKDINFQSQNLSLNCSAVMIGNTPTPGVGNAVLGGPLTTWLAAHTHLLAGPVLGNTAPPNESPTLPATLSASVVISA